MKKSWKKASSKGNEVPKKKTSSVSDTEVEITRRKSKPSADSVVITEAVAKQSKTVTAVATPKKTAVPKTKQVPKSEQTQQQQQQQQQEQEEKSSTSQVIETSQSVTQKQTKRQAPKKPARLSKSLPSSTTEVVKTSSNSKKTTAAEKECNNYRIEVEKTKKPERITAEQYQATQDFCFEQPQQPVIDCKTLYKDELLSLLRAANETTPINLKTTIIRSYSPSTKCEGHINVKKNDIVNLQYVLNELCYVTVKKGKKGYIPFSSTSSSFALAEPTPKSRRKFIDKQIAKKALLSEESGESLKTPKVKTKEVKVRKLSFGDTKEGSKTPKSKKKELKIRLEPLKDSSTTEGGSPTIQQRTEREVLSEGEETVKKNKGILKRGRSRSVDQELNLKKPDFRNESEDELVKPLEIRGIRSVHNRTSSVDTADELEIPVRPRTALEHRSYSTDTADESDFGRPATSLGRRTSNSSTSGFSEVSRGSSLERFLSPITQRKLKKFSNSDRDMNKLKFFSRKLTSKGTKEKSLRKSSSSSKMSDSEMSTSSSVSLVKVNNKKNGSKMTNHKRTHSLTDNYHLNWYRDWNQEPSDSSDSEDEYTTTDTESIKVQVKTTVRKDRSMSDYENTMPSNRLRFRRSSDVSASSEMYIPKHTQSQILRESNNNNTNASGFAQIYKTKSALQTKQKSSSSDILSTDSTTTTTKNEQQNTNLQKSRLSSGNSSLPSSKTKRKGTYASDNDAETLNSPLVESKNGKTAADILRGKCALSKQVPSVIESVLKKSRDNVMIVKSDFIAQEENFVTILTCQHVDVLDKSDSDWWWVRSPSGSEGFVPKDFLMAKPTVPSRKPDPNMIKRLGSVSPDNDINNNRNYAKNTNGTVTLPSSQQRLTRESPLLAKVAPLMREEQTDDINDISLYKKNNNTDFQKYPVDNGSSVVPPSYNQYMMRRQKSDLTDKYYGNKIPSYETQDLEQGLNYTKQWKSQERFSSGAQDPGGASRIVRRRSFSGRQKKVRFANQIVSSSDDGPKYQNSPGQILIIRQPELNQENYVKGDNSDQENEIATWC